MQAEELVRAGKLGEARKALASEIRADPASAPLRVFFFQLLCIQGELDKAITQLNVAAELDPANDVMAQVCRQLLQCEALRRDVFAGTRAPHVFGEPQEWIGHLVEAQRLTGQGHFAEAASLRDRAFDAAPACAGRITTGAPHDPESSEPPTPPDVTPFEWIADVDMRLGPVFEAIIEGRYFWVPATAVHKIEFDPPTDLRDLVWVPVQFTWVNGGQVIGFMPARYPGSETSNDDALALGRRTDFAEPDPSLSIAVGQRMFATDSGEHPMLVTRELEQDNAQFDPEELAKQNTEQDAEEAPTGG